MSISHSLYPKRPSLGDALGKKTFQNVFARTMRTAKKPSKTCLRGPCGQLKIFQNVFARAMQTADRDLDEAVIRGLTLENVHTLGDGLAGQTSEIDIGSNHYVLG